MPTLRAFQPAARRPNARTATLEPLGGGVPHGGGPWTCRASWTSHFALPHNPSDRHSRLPSTHSMEAVRPMHHRTKRMVYFFHLCAYSLCARNETCDTDPQETAWD